MNALEGKRICITRSEEYANKLIDQLQEHGAEAFALPLTETAPIYELDPFILTQILEHKYDAIALTSARGALYFVEHLNKSIRLESIPSHAQILAVGPATLEACRELGLNAKLCGEHSHDAAGMAAYIIAQGYKSVLHPTSTMGLDTLKIELEHAQLAYKRYPVYGAKMKLVDKSAWSEQVTAGVDFVLFFSPSAVKSMVSQKLPLPSAIAVGCQGKTTAAACIDLDLKVDLVLDTSKGEDWMEALIGYYDK